MGWPSISRVVAINEELEESCSSSNCPQHRKNKQKHICAKNFVVSLLTSASFDVYYVINGNNTCFCCVCRYNNFYNIFWTTLENFLLINCLHIRVQSQQVINSLKSLKIFLMVREKSNTG